MPARRLLSLLVMFLAASFAFVGPAAASDPYGPHSGAAQVNKTVVVQGGNVTFTGDGFCPNASVTVSVSADGYPVVTRHVSADADGDVSIRLTLSKLGTNTLRFSGCRAAGGTQTLVARVRVIPHQGAAKVSDDRVDKNDMVTVSGLGFCRRSDVVVRVFDDGHRYRRFTIQSDSNGRAATSVRLTRSGISELTLVGCRRAGGTQELSTSVKVRSTTSFHASPAARVVATASPMTVGAAAALLLALVLGQLVMFRNSRSSNR
jgi:hypothetical protein